MNKADEIFIKNINKIIAEGCWDENPRPRYESDGQPAHSVFITQVWEEYDLQKGELPITTLRPIGIKKAIKEMLWIYQDQTNELSVLKNKHDIHWWDLWEVKQKVVVDDEEIIIGGTIGQRYGATVRRYDLLNNFLNGLKKDPFGRRHIISLLQETDLKETDGLYPCAFQIIGSVRKVRGDYYFDLTLVQRSSDYIVAGHINMIQYVALQMMVAHECGYKVGKFARMTQNLHVYDRHLEQARELLERTPSPIQPELILNAEGKSFYDITVDDFKLENYHPVKPQLQFELGI